MLLFLRGGGGQAVRRARQLSTTRGDRFWKWTTQKRPHWKEDYKEAAVIFVVFGVTGSSSVYFVRPLLTKVGITGTMVDGPWSYRILSLILISPVYATILLSLGTISGRHNFFAKVTHSSYSSDLNNISYSFSNIHLLLYPFSNIHLLLYSFSNIHLLLYHTDGHKNFWKIHAKVISR